MEGVEAARPKRANTPISQKVFTKVVLQKSIPAKIRQLVLYGYSYAGYIDECVRELTFAYDVESTSCEIDTPQRYSDKQSNVGARFLAGRVPHIQSFCAGVWRLSD